MTRGSFRCATFPRVVSIADIPGSLCVSLSLHCVRTTATRPYSALAHLALRVPYGRVKQDLFCPTACPSSLQTAVILDSLFCPRPPRFSFKKSRFSKALSTANKPLMKRTSRPENIELACARSERKFETKVSLKQQRAETNERKLR